MNYCQSLAIGWADLHVQIRTWMCLMPAQDLHMLPGLPPPGSLAHGGQQWGRLGQGQREYTLLNTRAQGCPFGHMPGKVSPPRLQMVWIFIMNRMNPQSTSSSQRRRMALGIVILLLVDVIWVASSELTSYLCHENPMDSTERQKDMTPEDEPLRLEGVQYATGEEQRASTSSARKNEVTESKPKGHSVADVSGGERRVRCCKDLYSIGTWNVRSMNQGKLDVVKQEMTRLNIDILGISELKWTGMGEFNSEYHQIYYCRQESLRRNGVAFIVNKRVGKAVLGYNLQNDRMISVRIEGKPFSITAVQFYAPTTGAEEAEVDQFYEGLQHLLELTPENDVLIFMGDWNAKSEPLYVPVKFHDLPAEKCSSTNSDNEKTPKKPRVRFSNIMEIRQLPSSHALEAKLSRMSYPTVKEQDSILKAVGKLTASQVAKISFFFCFVWFLANFSYQEALSDTQVAIVNILSSTSGLFTLILAAVFPSNSGDRFTLSKLLAVILSVGIARNILLNLIELYFSNSIGGVVLVNLSGSEKSSGRDTIGSLWSLVGAMLYAIYIVMIKRKVDREDKLDIPMFFGFVGLFNLLLLWPGFFLLHYTEFEPFEFPSKLILMCIVINGLVGTVLSEFLWLCHKKLVVRSKA
ncbi:Solute carrier family 35 member F5 [Varanus komodoensis]|nr:Solute carrier family 35 member F5 [Varanus komodoensis]